jgi:hypothetical protein
MVLKIIPDARVKNEGDECSFVEDIADENGDLNEITLNYYKMCRRRFITGSKKSRYKVTRFPNTGFRLCVSNSSMQNTCFNRSSRLNLCYRFRKAEKLLSGNCCLLIYSRRCWWGIPSTVSP